MRPSPKRSYIAAIVSIAIVLILTGPLVAVAVPSNPDISEAQTRLAAAEEELDRMAVELEIEVEEYNRVSEALLATRAQIAETEQALASAREDVRNAEEALSARVSAIYRDGGTQAVLEVLLGTRSFEDFLVRLDWVTRVSRQDAVLVGEVRVAKAKVEDAKLALEQREAEQTVLRDEVASRRLAIENSIRKQEGYVESLDSEVKQLIAEEEERQRQLAQQRAAEAARKAAEAAAQQSKPADPQTPVPSGPGRADVVQIALEYLGVPYAWGGSSPSAGFDCSGLTQHVYAQVGIEIPRTSRQQFRSGTRVPASDLQSLRLGDLVFFGYEGDPEQIHHVGIYAGDGNFIHAPQTGEVVKVSSLIERIARKGDYVGASRF